MKYDVFVLNNARKPMPLPGGRSLDFSGPVLVMAIVNCNEDSFYVPSRAMGEAAVEKALAAEKDGASIIDFGAESTRPGSSYISAEEELERLIPVIASFRKLSNLPVSADTRKAVVAAAALKAGADIINDISALCDDPDMAAVCAGYGAAVILTHKKGVPRYDDLAGEIKSFFQTVAGLAIAAGIKREKIIVDPGFGFGKNTENNLEILRRLAEICGTDYPVLAALSRKRFIGEITGQEEAGRLSGTLAANAAAIMNGADIVRVHDVREHADLVKMIFALRRDTGVI